MNILRLLLLSLVALQFAAQRAGVQGLPHEVTVLGRTARTSNLPTQSNPSLRIRHTLNSSWRFHRQDEPQAQLPAFDDQSWDKVNLPHTWNIEDTLDDPPGYYRGAGWYRRHLPIGTQLEGKRLYLYFEGANQVTDVYVNGQHAGQHIGGYTAFCFEITQFVDFGSSKPNLIAIKVDNSHDDSIPPLTADFNFYGGIYRDVWLVAVDPIHFTMLDHAATGVYIDTPEVSAEQAVVRVRGKVINSSDTSSDLEVVSSVIDAQGQVVTTLRSSISLGSKGEANFVQTSDRLRKPKLWSPENPYLYSVRTVVLKNGQATDEVINPLGFRWFSFDPERGFFLNGRHLKLRGTNRHQDYASLGNAVPDALQVRDLELIKDTGFNFLRLAHYPQDPAVLETADRLGLIIWEEIPIVNQIVPSAKFTENSKRMLTEMIRQHHNHPSIILWGYMNEVFLGPKMADEKVKATVELARVLEQICRQEDPNRVTTIAFDHGARELYNSSGLGDVTQVVGWNLYHGWYYEEFPDFGKFLDEQHRKFPRRPLIVSEYGANGDTRLHSEAPKRFDSTLEWQRQFHEAYLSQINARSFVAGSAIWNQFDFGSEFRGETIPHINQKGMFTFDRRPKDTHYFYKAQFSEQPVLHIASADWQWRAGPASKSASTQVFDVYTNLAAVELLHNGISLGRKAVDMRRKASWKVPLLKGSNSLVARGTRRGRTIVDQIEVRYEAYPGKFSEGGLPPNGLAVNVGSNAQFIDAAGTVWLADQPYQEGSWGYIGPESKASSTLRNVLDTGADPLYQTMQLGLEGYRFAVPEGEYEIELRLVEHEFTKPGRRVFSVSQNDNLWVPQLDLFDQFGPLQAVSLRTIAKVRGGRGLNIDFKPLAGRPTLSGIRIRRLFTGTRASLTGTPGVANWDPGRR